MRPDIDGASCRSARPRGLRRDVGSDRRLRGCRRRRSARRRRASRIALGEERELLALGVGRADDVDRLHAAAPPHPPARFRAPPARPLLATLWHEACGPLQSVLRCAYHFGMGVSFPGEEDRGRAARSAGADHEPDARNRLPPDAGGRNAVGQRGRRGRRRVARHRLPLLPEPGRAGPGRGRRGARARSSSGSRTSTMPRRGSPTCWPRRCRASSSTRRRSRRR